MAQKSWHHLYCSKAQAGRPSSCVLVHWNKHKNLHLVFALARNACITQLFTRPYLFSTTKRHIPLTKGGNPWSKGPKIQETRIREACTKARAISLRKLKQKFEIRTKTYTIFGHVQAITQVSLTYLYNKVLAALNEDSLKNWSWFWFCDCYRSYCSFPSDHFDKKTPRAPPIIPIFSHWQNLLRYRKKTFEFYITPGTGHQIVFFTAMTKGGLYRHCSLQRFEPWSIQNFFIHLLSDKQHVLLRDYKIEVLLKHQEQTFLYHKKLHKEI